MGLATVGGYPVKQDYIPHLYSPILLEKFHDNTFMTKICNRDYEGDLKKAGDQITIRGLPDIKTFRYKKGMNIPFQGYETTSTTFPVERSRGYAFKVNSIDEKLSDLNGWVNQWTDEGAIALAQDNEMEFLEDIYSYCDAANAGVAAGYRSASYDLGATATPLEIYKTTQTAEHKSSAIDAVATAAACLEEQKGGMGVDPWIIIPVWMGLYIQTGELKEVSLSGDDASLLRKNVKALGSLAGFTVYTSNLLKVDANEAATGGKSYNVIFGDKKAITFAEQISITEVKDNPFEPGKLHSSIMVYDWFPIQPTRFGHMIICKG